MEKAKKLKAEMENRGEQIKNLQSDMEAAISMSRGVKDEETCSRLHPVPTPTGPDKKVEKWSNIDQWKECDFEQIWGKKSYAFIDETGSLMNNVMYHWTRKSRFSALFTILTMLL